MLTEPSSLIDYFSRVITKKCAVFVYLHRMFLLEFAFRSQVCEQLTTGDVRHQEV